MRLRSEKIIMGFNWVYLKFSLSKKETTNQSKQNKTQDETKAKPRKQEDKKEWIPKSNITKWR